MTEASAVEGGCHDREFHCLTITIFYDDPARREP